MAPNHLIIVCCHGIWFPTTSPTNSLEDEANWFIAPFQKGETSTFVRHIKEALKVLRSDEDALLVFSGGPTRIQTRHTEARSYYKLAYAARYWDIFPQAQTQDEGTESQPDFRDRISTENKALDSYQNVLFSLLKFWQKTGTWPQKVTIVSHEFKRARFVNLHLNALRWEGDVEYLGIDPEYMTTKEDNDVLRAAEVREGEQIRGYDVWAEDLYGVGEILIEKRKQRNPWGISQTVWEEGMGVEVHNLIEWHGGTVFDGQLPWNQK